MFASPDTIRDEMMDAVRAIAGERGATDSIKCMITKAARRATMPATRIKKYWYGEVSVIPAHEADHLRAVRARELRTKQTMLRAELDQLQREIDAWR